MNFDVMKLLTGILFFLLSFSSLFGQNEGSDEKEEVVKGVYQGKNLYVQNPFTSDMKDFCTNKVYVNDKEVLSDIKSSAFEVPFDSMAGLKVNDKITVRIIHKSDCKPKVLNAQVIRLTSDFKFTDFSIDEDGLHWSTKGERKGDELHVQQFLYNNWETIEKISSKGSATQNSYDYTDHQHHSGVNKYRIKYVEQGGTVYYSKVIEFKSNMPEVTFHPKRVTNRIYLSRPVRYEVIDGYGTPVIKGEGEEINCLPLKEGVYYLNVDNKTEKFLKK